MITGELKSKIDRIWDTMWSGGISNPLSVIEQLTYLLFIKRLDELHTLKERKAARTGKPIEGPIFAADQDRLRWSRFKEAAPEQMFETVRDGVFPFIKTLGQKGEADGEGGSTYTHHMKDAFFMMPTARVLASVVDQLDDIDMADSDTKGDLYEYMLGKIATAGQNGQFRTPRHIIKLMVDMTAPTPKDVICDPACGTAGFLIATSKYLVEHHSDTIYKDTGARRRFNEDTFHGYDREGAQGTGGDARMRMVPLGAHAKLIRGITFKPADKCDAEDRNAVVCMRTKNVQTTLDESDLIAVPSNLVKDPEKVISPGDVLVSSANSWSLVGKCCQVRNLRYPSAAGGFISILRPTTEELDPSYLYRWFSSVNVQRRVRSFGNQTTNISNLDHKRTLKLQIPLPPLAEQKRIAGILDAADALRAKRRESLAQLYTLLQSTFLDMFGDPVTNPMGWDVRPMGQSMRIRRGGSPRPIQKYLGGNINWIKISDATSSANDIYITSCAQKITADGLSKTTLLEPGSFVFANSGVSLGFARILKIKGAIHDGWLAFDRFAPDVLNALFFLKALNGITDHFRRTAPAGTQPNLNTGIMKAFGLFLPPIDLQNHFAAVVESVEQQKASQRVHLDELDTLFGSLQSRAFAGDL